MLEMVLAMAIGGIVLIATLGLFASLEGAEARAAARARATYELGNLRVVAQRAMATLLVDDSPMPGAGIGQPAPAEVEEDGTLPRMALGPMPTAGAQRALRRARAVSGGSGASVQAPQRFELLLNRPPMATRPPSLSLRPQTRAPRISSASTSERGLGAIASGPARGAFELWPEGHTPGSLDADLAWASAETMTLWWVPMLAQPADVRGEQAAPGITGEAPPEDGSRVRLPQAPGVRPDVSLAGEPVALVTGLTFCQWRVFHERERKTTFQATRLLELPAYIELELETAEGVYANWMFELMWTVGEDPAMAAAEDGAEGGDLPAEVDEPLPGLGEGELGEGVTPTPAGVTGTGSGSRGASGRGGRGGRGGGGR